MVKRMSGKSEERLQLQEEEDMERLDFPKYDPPSQVNVNRSQNICIIYREERIKSPLRTQKSWSREQEQEDNRDLSKTSFQKFDAM